MNRPFDAARYAGLLEGLEVSEILLSKLENAFTIGAEYYAPAFLRPVKTLLASNYQKQSLKASCSLITDGDHGSADYAEHGIPFVLSEAVQVGWVDWEACRFITQKHAATLRRSMLRTGDVLVSKTGVYFGRSAVVSEELSGANTIAHVGILRPRANIDPYFLSMFLNSTYGYSQLRRRGIKATRPEIKLLEFDEIIVPLVSKSFASAIHAASLVAANTRVQARNQVADASDQLLKLLGLEDWQPPQLLSYIRSSRDAFAAGRLDAEYFKPGCAELEAHLRATGSACTLQSLLTINERGTQPDYADAGLPVVNSKHVVNNEVRLDDENRTAQHGARMLRIRQGDVLMNGTGVGTIGRAAPYLHVSEALPDNHVTVLRPKTGAIDPVYLAVFLNSLAGRLQVEKRLRGSSGQIELYPNDIAQFLVWQAPNEVQLSIRRSVETAFAAKQRAAALLDAAKRAVEIAIENSEAAALAWLQDARARAEGAP